MRLLQQPLVSFTVGLRQKEVASVGAAALTDLQDRIADRLGIDSIRMFQSIRPRGARRYATSSISFGLAVLLSIGAVGIRADPLRAVLTGSCAAVHGGR
ncbi:hypothetical protein [Actinomadura sp. 3N407]|uniref:hypothetical protein n=1 Tax=Actinomadura sp. 3N407 TaxID=3457423 RepID=UPI003FCE1EB0